MTFWIQNPFGILITVQKILQSYNEDMIQPILVEKTRTRFRGGKLLVRIMTFLTCFLNHLGSSCFVYTVMIKSRGNP